METCCNSVCNKVLRYDVDWDKAIEINGMTFCDKECYEEFLEEKGAQMCDEKQQDI